MAAFSGARAFEGCDEKAKLLKEYDRATAMFSKAVATLNAKMGTSPKAVYDGLRMAADEARMKSEHARLALERHSAEHGC